MKNNTKVSSKSTEGENWFSYGWTFFVQERRFEVKQRILVLPTLFQRCYKNYWKNLNYNWHRGRTKPCYLSIKRNLFVKQRKKKYWSTKEKWLNVPYDCYFNSYFDEYNNILFHISIQYSQKIIFEVYNNR